MSYETLAVLAVFTAPPAFFAFTAVFARSLPKSLSYASLACGLAVFPISGLLVALTEGPDGTTAYSPAAAYSVIGAAFFAIFFGVWSWFSRLWAPGDRPTVGPILGILLGFFGVCSGAGSLLLVSLTSDSGKPWTHHAPKDAYQVTLPSERWVFYPPEAGSLAVRFERKERPEMTASVVEVRPAETEAEYEGVVASWEYRFKADSPQPLDTQRGVNAAGHPYWYALGREAMGRRYVYGMSVTWLDRKQAVVMTFHGHYMPTKNEYIHEMEERTFRSSAVSIFTSVTGPAPKP